jgi:putative oxidoreductase
MTAATRYDRGRQTLLRVLDPDYGVLILRAGTGVMVTLIHGLHKVEDGLAFFIVGRPWPLIAEVVELGLPFPVLFAELAAAGQLVGGLFLGVGLFTRISAATVAFTMLVAVTANLKLGGPDTELAALYSLISLSFAFIGGGRISLDQMWRLRSGR